MSGPLIDIDERCAQTAADALRAHGLYDIAHAIYPRRVWRTAFCVPVKTTAHVNEHRHWRSSHAEAAKEKKALRASWVAAGSPAPPSLPVHFRFTRVAPRGLDKDNLPTASKFLQDELCRCLGLARKNGQAMDEGDVVRVRVPHQERGEPKTYSVRVEMWTEADEPDRPDILTTVAGR